MAVQQLEGDGAPLASWRRLLEERARQAVDAFARVDGVIGLILCGGVGRREPWPLSDIDMIPIYEDGRAEAAAAELAAGRNELLDWWAAEGCSTCLDIGKLKFARSEAREARALPPGEATRYLDDPRWFHSLDKGYGGKAVFDPEGLAAELSEWLTAARFAPEVVRGRLEAHWRRVGEAYEEAVARLGEGEVLAASVALRESLHALTRSLIEGWGGRDNSWARFGTRLELLAAERGEADLVVRIMALYGLSPGEVARRIALAPEGIRERHRLSLQGRRLVGEPVTAEQDARDVLLVFGTREARYRRPPYGEWVGLESDPAIVGERVDEYERLLRGLNPRAEGRWDLPALATRRG